MSIIMTLRAQGDVKKLEERAGANAGTFEDIANVYGAGHQAVGSLFHLEQIEREVRHIQDAIACLLDQLQGCIVFGWKSGIFAPVSASTSRDQILFPLPASRHSSVPVAPCA